MTVSHIPVLSSRPRPLPSLRCCSSNPSNLISLPLPPSRTLSGALWNCHSSANKADFISAFASHLSLDFLALTETWLSPDNTVTPAALSSLYVLSHTPRLTGRGGGTGLLLSPSLLFSVPSDLTSLSVTTFEFHAVQLTSPCQLLLIVLYRPPGPLTHFLDELDYLLSSLPSLSTPTVLLGDFNIHLSNPSHSAGFLPLLHSFDFCLSPSPPTHKAGRQLDLTFSRACCPSTLSVTPLDLSDHYFISFSLSLPPLPAPPTPTVTSRRNLRSLSPSVLASTALSHLPPIDSFSQLSVDSATSTLFSSLTSSLDSLCPLTSRPARPSPPHPWLSSALRSARITLRSAEKKWKRTKLPAALDLYRTLLSSFSSTLSSAKCAYFQSVIQASTNNPRKLFSTFSSLLNPPPSSSLLYLP